MTYKNLKKYGKGSFVLLLIIAANSILLYSISSNNLVGFAINSDETAYFSLSRSIHYLFSYQNHAQYNPLYPFINSFIFFYDDITKIPSLIRFFNTIAFSSMIIPLHLICKRFFTDKQKIWTYILPTAIICLPWKATVPYIVAESYYYTFFVWCMYLYLLFIEKKNIQKGFTLGFFLGMTFLLKQSGLITVFSVFAGLCYEFLFIDKRKPLYIKPYIAVFAAALMFILPWVIRNNISTQTSIGYASELSTIYNNIFNFSGISKYFLLNLSYIVLGSFIIFFAVYIYTIIKIKSLPDEKQSFVLLTFIMSIGILILCSFHYINTNFIPYGRYSTVIIPIVLIIGISTLINPDAHINKIFLTASVILLGILCIFFDPIIKTMNIKGIFNNFDSALWSGILLNNLPWVHEPIPANIKENLFGEAITRAIIVVLVILSLFILYIRNISIKSAVILVLFMFIGIQGYQNAFNAANKIGNSTNPTNEIFMYLLNNGINSGNVYYEPNAPLAKETASAWFGNSYAESAIKMPKEIFSSRLLDNVELFFDFGGEKTPIAEGALPVIAPWKGEYLYSPDVYYGFDLSSSYNGSQFFIHSYQSTKHPDNNDSTEDSIYGLTENIFYVNKPKGNYNIQFIMDTSPSPFPAIPLDFNIYVNDIFIAHITDEKKANINIDKFANMNDILQIKFVPQKEKSMWSISGLKIGPDKDSSPLRNIYIISSVNSVLPFETVYENSRFKLYYKP